GSFVTEAIRVRHPVGPWVATVPCGVTTAPAAVGTGQVARASSGGTAGHATGAPRGGPGARRAGESAHQRFRPTSIPGRAAAPRRPERRRAGPPELRLHRPLRLHVADRREGGRRGRDGAVDVPVRRP